MMLTLFTLFTLFILFTIQTTSHHLFLRISLAYNVISCREVAKNTQILKFARVLIKWSSSSSWSSSAQIHLHPNCWMDLITSAQHHFISQTNHCNSSKNESISSLLDTILLPSQISSSSFQLIKSDQPHIAILKVESISSSDGIATGVICFIAENFYWTCSTSTTTEFAEKPHSFCDVGTLTFRHKFIVIQDPSS